MSTRLDHSPTGVLALCSRCPSWREWRPTTTAAWSAGLSHARAVHGSASDEARHAEKNLYKRQKGMDPRQGYPS